MVFGKLIDLIERNAGVMAARWRDGMRASEYARTYQRLSDEELVRRSQEVFTNLGRWLSQDPEMHEIGRVYVAVGKERYREGFPLCEVQFAVHYTKKVLWNHVLSEGIMTSALEIYQAMDLIVRMHNFFDITAFYITRGYLEEMYFQMARNSGMDPDKLKSFFPPGSFLCEYQPHLL